MIETNFSLLKYKVPDLNQFINNSRMAGICISIRVFFQYINIQISRTVSLFSILFLITGVLSFQNSVYGQCVSYPVSLEQRVLESNTIVKARVKDKIAYKDQSGNIYTLNLLEIQDILKGDTNLIEIGAITIGGEIGNEIQLSYPAVQLTNEKEYVLFLEDDNRKLTNADLNNSHPDLSQCLIYADGQGAFELQNGTYYDALYHQYYPEGLFFSLILKLNGENNPKRLNMKNNRINIANVNASVSAIASVSPNTTKGGTVNAGDFITISGSGFGATRGTNNVSFRNVNDGGATWITPIASDYTAWSDGSITVKVPENAGTGLIDVAGTLSPSVLTIGYTHASVNSSFSGFGSATRQRYYLRDKNGNGGYTFSPNSTSGFSGNAAAVTTLRDAMDTWTCNTGMNWEIGTATTSAFANDNENVVLFDATLPAGVLGRLTSRLQAGSTGGCSGTNTVWWVNEMDLQVKPDPPVAGTTWEYGPSLPSLSEYDLESVLLHELGHAHGLGHRIASGQTMHYALFNGAATRSLDTNEIRAGIDKMAYSTPATCFNPSGSGTPMSTQSCSLSLPVELLSLDARKQEDDVLISWTTLSEFNNDFYTIEKSSDALDFQPIGRVDGAGNSKMETNYRFMDNHPHTGINYYRLKQTDFDGSYSYSGIVQVYFDENAQPEIAVFPNPARESITIQFKDTHAGVWVSISDINGSLVYGDHITSVDENYRNVININHLPDGIYLLKFVSDGNTSVTRFIKN